MKIKSLLIVFVFLIATTIISCGTSSGGSSSSKSICAILFDPVDFDDGIFGGMNGGGIMGTEDAGSSFVAVEPLTYSTSSLAVKGDGSIVLGVGEDGSFFRADNNAGTITTGMVDSSYTGKLNYVLWPNLTLDIAYTFGNDGFGAKSIDGGDTWPTTLSTGITTDILGGCYADEDYIRIVGDKFVSDTTDGGDTFNPNSFLDSNGDPIDISDITFRDCAWSDLSTGAGVIVGGNSSDEAVSWYTINNGDNWSPSTLPSGLKTIYKVDFDDTYTNSVAVGENFAIRSKGSSGAVWDQFGNADFATLFLKALFSLGTGNIAYLGGNDEQLWKCDNLDAADASDVNCIKLSFRYSF